MTARITQHVVARQRAAYNFSSQRSLEGTWQIRPVRTSAKRSLFTSQRGSVTHATVTVGFSVLCLVVVAVLGFFYLQQILHTASRGSDVQALEVQIVELREKQRSLELQGAELRSIQAVEKRVKELNLVGVEQVAYLVTQPQQVAAVAR